MSNLENSALLGLEKEELIKIIFNLKTELTKRTEEFEKITNLRLYHLERSHYMNLQYNRRESFEISGIPDNVSQENLEDEVVDICKEAKVKVNYEPMKKKDIVACHRVGKRGVVVCRVMNRKFSREAIICGKNLKGTDRYGGSNIYINNSFTPEYKYINYAVRMAKKDNRIHRYKIRNGINYIQRDEESSFVEIGHVLDLTNLGIPVPPRK